MTAFLSEEKAAAFLKTGAQNTDAFNEFAASLLHHCQEVKNLSSSSPVFEQVWCSPACAPLKEMYKRFEKVGRCFIHLCCGDAPENYEDDSIGDADVMFFYQYAGDAVMEKSLRRLFTNPETWFHREVLELIKKGAGAALNSDKVQELQQLLKSDQPKTPSFLKQVSHLVETVRNLTMSQKMANILGSFAITWITITT